MDVVNFGGNASGGRKGADGSVDVLGADELLVVLNCLTLDE